MNFPLVTVEALVKRYGTVAAVDGISFAFDEGSVFGLLGPNGRGKSTTIKMLVTLALPSGGRAEVGGFDIVRQASNVRELIGYVPQAISVDGALTGLENLSVMARLTNVPRAVRRQRIESVLELLDLGDAAKRRASTYSGGLIRRLEIGQAIPASPAAAGPRRTHRRPRPCGAPKGLEPFVAPATGNRPRSPPDHPLYGRGRGTVRHHRDHESRPDRGPRKLLRISGPRPESAGQPRRPVHPFSGSTEAAPEEGRWKEERRARRTAKRLG